jgi:hypothetical protein
MNIHASHSRVGSNGALKHSITIRGGRDQVFSLGVLKGPALLYLDRLQPVA